MPNPLMESFQWFPKDYSPIKTTDKSVIIKVKAGRGGEISKNNRLYLHDELIRAARTATGQKIDVNHNQKQIGKILVADYEEGDLEFVCEVWKDPYATLLRTKNSEIRGFSISADYLTNECSRCHKRFSTEQEYLDHMSKEEFIHNTVTIPRGIVFGEYALSIVTSNEIPGLETSFEVMETVGKDGYSQLLETVIKRKIEEEKYMSKVALKKEEKIAAGHKVITNVNEPISVTEQVVIEVSKLPKIEEQILTKKPSLIAEKTLVVNEHMKLGEPCSPELRACVDALIADGKEESSAWAICKSKLGETVIPSKTITLKEAVSIGKLVFKAKENQSFEDCVAEGNSPEECARRFKDTKEQNASNEMLVNVVNEIVDVVSKSIVLVMPEIKIPKDDTSWKQTIEALPKDDLSWKELKIPEPYDDKPLKETIAGIKPYNDEALKTKLGEMEEKLKEIPALKETINQLKEQVAEVPKLKETITQQKKDFDNLLDAADKSVKEYFALNKKEMVDKDQKIKDLEEKLGKSIEENAKTKTIAETAKIEAENASDKLKPEFKAKSKQAEVKQNSSWEP